MNEETRDIAVEARTLAREAHKRSDGLDRAIIEIRRDLGLLREAVASLKTKAGFYAGVGAILGSGVVGAALHFWK